MSPATTQSYFSERGKRF